MSADQAVKIEVVCSCGRRAVVADHAASDAFDEHLKQHVRDLEPVTFHVEHDGEDFDTRKRKARKEGTQ